MAGAVAIWHDIEPEGGQEFYAWHGEEHMPERVSIPASGAEGASSPSRLISASSTSTTLTRPMSCADRTTRRDWIPRLRARSPPCAISARWRARALQRGCGFQRAQSQRAQGGLVATLRLAVEEADEARMLASVERSILPGLTALRRRRVQVLIADRAASGYVNAEQRARAARPTRCSFVIVAEGWGDEASFRAAVGAIGRRVARWNRLARRRSARLLPARAHGDAWLTGFVAGMPDFDPFTNRREWFVYGLYAAPWERSRRREDAVTTVTLSRRESILAAFAAAAMATTSLGGEVERKPPATPCGRSC